MLTKHETVIPLPKGVRESLLRASKAAKEGETQEARHLSAIQRAEDKTIARFHLVKGDTATLRLLMDEYLEVELEYDSIFCE